jgi:hypothetical protein
VAHIIELPLSVLDDALVVDTNMSTSYADNIYSGFKIEEHIVWEQRQ